MVTLLMAAALQGQEPVASRCAAAYIMELARKEGDGSLPKPKEIDVSKIKPEQLAIISKLEPFVTEGRVWVALAFSQEQSWQALPSAVARLTRFPNLLASDLTECEQMKAADQRPIPLPPLPPSGQGDQCGAEDVAIHRKISEGAPAAIVRADALSALSRLEDGKLTCQSLDEARYTWMEIGSAAAAAVAKATDTSR